MSRSARSAIHAVILAGGAGERFWPASRWSRPKPLLRVAGGRSLIEATLARARRFAAPDRIWVVCGREHAKAIRAATGLPARRVLIEPERRNTAMAVAFSALRVAADDPDAVMAVLPADHRIPDARAFAAAIRRAADAARRAGVIVTLGVEPTQPDTGYGYIQLGPPAGAGFEGLHRVRRFVEKPDRKRAARFLRQGRYLWNAGIFIWTARTILEELEACAPDLWQALAPLRGSREARPRSGRAASRRRAKAGSRQMGRSAALRAAYRKAPSLPIDVAVIERSRRVWTLPAAFRWSDVGTWASLAQELGVSPEQTRVIAGEVVGEEAPGNLVWGSDRLIALLGVEGLAVIDAGDVILVTKLDRSPDVRRLVAVLRRKGQSDLV